MVRLWPFWSSDFRQTKPSATRKKYVNRLFFLLSKAPLLRRQQAGVGGIQFWVFGKIFIDPPPRGEGVPHITKNPYTAAWNVYGIRNPSPAGPKFFESWALTEDLPLRGI